MKNTAVKGIPDGYHTLTPFITAKNTEKLIDFMQNGLGATTVSVYKHPNGVIMHAEVQIGDSRVMLSEATEQFPARSATLYMYVEDCDAVYKKALQAGGTSMREPTDEFYGDRSCGISDLAGNQWWIATHVEDISPEEMKKREEEWRNQQATG